MSFAASLLKDCRIVDVHMDSEVTYLMMSNGTQVTIRGLVVIEPKSPGVVEVESASNS